MDTDKGQCAGGARGELRGAAGQFAGGVFQGSGTLGKIGLENETRWEPEEIADKLANHPEVQAAFLQSEGKSLEPVYRDKQFDRFFSNATSTRWANRKWRGWR